MRESDFLSMVSHELKTPIAVITGLAHTLSEGRHALTEAQIDDCLARITRQGDRLARLVADLLDLSQVESGSFRVSLQPVNLAGTAELALDGAPSPPDKSVELDIPESLWAQADPSRVEQILVNLLTNAYRYGGSTIRLEARDTSDGTVVTVAQRRLLRTTRTAHRRSSASGRALPVWSNSRSAGVHPRLARKSLHFPRFR